MSDEERARWVTEMREQQFAMKAFIERQAGILESTKSLADDVMYRLEREAADNERLRGALQKAQASFLHTDNERLRGLIAAGIDKDWQRPCPWCGESPDHRNNDTCPAFHEDGRVR
jgi:hypothetical protein